MTHQETLDAMVAAFRSFAILATCIDAGDIERARAAVSLAESAGAIVDPTAYRRAISNDGLARQRRAIDLFTNTTAELKELFPDGWPA